MRLPIRMITLSMAATIAALFVVLAFFPWANVEYRWTVLGGIVLAMQGVIALFGPRQLGMVDAVMRRYCLLVAHFFVLSSSLFFLLTENSATRYGLMVLVPMVLCIYFYNLATLHTTSSLVHLTSVLFMAYAIVILSFFFFLVFLFDIVLFFAIPVVVLSLIAAGATALVTKAAFWQAGISMRRERLLVAAFALLGGELYAALSMLPTSSLVDALTEVVVCVTGLRICQYVLTGQSRHREVRRQVIAACVCVAVILGTAQWL